MSLYSSEQKQKEERQRARYLALQKQKEIQMTKKVSRQLSATRRRVLSAGNRSLRVFINRALTLQNRIAMNIIRQRIRFAMLIRKALRSPGLGMPFFIGISLTWNMRRLIAKIIRKKNDIWMFALREQWLNNERAKARSGQKASAEFAWLRESSRNDDIFKMKATIEDGKMAATSQQNEYHDNMLWRMKQTAADGIHAAKSRWNDMQK